MRDGSQEKTRVSIGLAASSFETAQPFSQCTQQTKRTRTFETNRPFPPSILESERQDPCEEQKAQCLPLLLQVSTCVNYSSMHVFKTTALSISQITSRLTPNKTPASHAGPRPVSAPLADPPAVPGPSTSAFNESTNQQVRCCSDGFHRFFLV